jgi:hypothetical protein
MWDVYITYRLQKECTQPIEKCTEILCMIVVCREKRGCEDFAGQFDGKMDSRSRQVGMTQRSGGILLTISGNEEEFHLGRVGKRKRKMAGR